MRPTSELELPDESSKVALSTVGVGQRAWLCLGLALVALGVLLVSSRIFTAAYFGNVVDDAIISMQYARNLAEGNGLVFNVGERVEGYTNFLWTLALAALHWSSTAAGFEFLPAAVWMSVAAAAVCVWLVYLLGRELWGHDPLPLVVALGFVVWDNAWGVWAIQALEGHFLLVWMLLALWLAEKRPARWPIGVGLCLAAVVMSRPDGALIGVAIALSELAALPWRLKRRDPTLVADLKAWGLALATFAVVFGVYFAWRTSYFGMLLPNTFYLKVGGGVDGWARGFRYVVGFFSERAWLPLIAVGAVFTVRRTLIRTLLIYTIVHLVYVASVGGDFYPGHRFLLVVIPFLALLSGETIRLVSHWIGKALPAQAGEWATMGMILLSVGAVVLLARVGLRDGPWRTEIKRWGPTIQNNRLFMEWVRSVRPEGATMALGDIGAAGFFADVAVIDIFGVVDPVIAHQKVESLGKGKAGHEKKASRAYVLEKEPTYIKLGYLPGDFWSDGYYLNGEMPVSLKVEGLWTKDDLPGRAEKIPGAAVEFTEGEWIAEGTAFEGFPHRGRVRGQKNVVGVVGAHVNTYRQGIGDEATGRLRSPPFLLEGDLITLRVGGGHEPEKLRVSLLVDGETIHTATGRNSEMLHRKEWDVSAHKGREAILEIVDDADGGWGHILVDEIEQWLVRSSGTAAR